MLERSISVGFNPSFNKKGATKVTPFLKKRIDYFNF
jgi:hypothetical protein